MFQRIRYWIRGRKIKKEFPQDGGFQFAIAKTAEESEKVFQLRFQVYVESGYINPGEFPGQRFTDPYDENSLFALITKGGATVGCTRVVLPSPKGFPIFDYYRIVKPDIPADELGEISRFCVQKDYRSSTGRMITLGLLFLLAEASHARNIKYWYAFMPEALARSFKGFGIEFTMLEELPLEEKHNAARRPMTRYFEKTKAKPYVVSVERVRALFKMHGVSFPIA